MSATEETEGDHHYTKKIPLSRDHQLEMAEQRRLHLYQLKTLQGQLLDNLITQVSDPDKPVSQEIQEEITRTLKLVSGSSVAMTPTAVASPVATTTAGHGMTSMLEGRGDSAQNNEGTQSSPHSIGLYNSFGSSESSLRSSSPVSLKQKEDRLPVEYSPVDPSVSLEQASVSSPEKKIVSESFRFPLSPRTLNETVIPDSLKENSSVSSYVPLSGMEYWMNENETLRKRNGQLNEQLKRHGSVQKIMKEKVAKLQRQLSKYEEESESHQNLVLTLREHLSSTISQLKEQEKRNDEVISQLHSVKKELQSARKAEIKAQKMLESNTDKLERSLEENASLHHKMRLLEEHVKDLELEVDHLHSLLNKHKYSKDCYQYTIHELEDKVQRLKEANIRLKTTHMVTASPPRHSFSNDRGHSPLSRSPSPSPSPSQISVSSKPPKRPLTRKRWLETSEGGFVFGTPTSPHNTSGESPPISYTAAGKRTSSPGSRRISGNNSLSPVENVLEAVRKKHVTAVSPPVSKKGERDPKRMSIEERVEERLKKAREAESKLVDLQRDKERLESFLRRGPPSNKVTADLKQRQREAESQLDEVMKEIGSLRMIVRNTATWKR